MAEINLIVATYKSFIKLKATSTAMQSVLNFVIHFHFVLYIYFILSTDSRGFVHTNLCALSLTVLLFVHIRYYFPLILFIDFFFLEAIQFPNHHTTESKQRSVLLIAPFPFYRHYYFSFFSWLNFFRVLCRRVCVFAFCYSFIYKRLERCRSP